MKQDTMNTIPHHPCGTARRTGLVHIDDNQEENVMDFNDDISSGEYHMHRLISSSRTNLALLSQMTVVITVVQTLT